jgi:hypothetical protein
MVWRRDSVAGIVDTLLARPRHRTSISGRGKKLTSYPKCPDQLWPTQCAPWCFPREYSGRWVALTTPQLRMGGAIPPLSHKLSWCSQWQAYFYLFNYVKNTWQKTLNVTLRRRPTLLTSSKPAYRHLIVQVTETASERMWIQAILNSLASANRTVRCVTD